MEKTRNPNGILDPARHRELAVALFNHTWDLLEKRDRTSAEDEEMVHGAHASCWHWSRAEGGGPANQAIGEWQCSRVYAVLGRGEAAAHHAGRSLAICREHGLEGFVLAYAWEARARAAKVRGLAAELREYRDVARAAGERIAEEEDRWQFQADLRDLLEGDA